MQRKTINDLSAAEYAEVETLVKDLFYRSAKSLLTIGKRYSIDANELFDWWLMLAENYKASNDLNTLKGVSFEEFMHLISKLKSLIGAEE